jgi:chromosome partitioning protein
MREQGIPMFGTQLHERDPYRAIFAFGGTLRNLDTKQVRGVEAAMSDVEALANEIIGRLDEIAVRSKREKVA